MAGLRLTWAAHGAHVQRCGEKTSIHKCDNLCRNLARSLLIQARGKTRRGASCLKANEIIVLGLLLGREDTPCSPDGPCDHSGPVTRVHLPSGCSRPTLSAFQRGPSGCGGSLMCCSKWGHRRADGLAFTDEMCAHADSPHTCASTPHGHTYRPFPTPHTQAYARMPVYSCTYSPHARHTHIQGPSSTVTHLPSTFLCR